MSNNSAILLANCLSELMDTNTTLQNCLSDLDACNVAGEGLCAPAAQGAYDLGLHIAAIFIVLIASFTGAIIPIFLKYHPGWNLDPYYICLGKCMGIGVILACALVHMLQPSSQSLVAPCLPAAFNTEYQAYAFLYCMLAVLAMHFIDYMMEAYIENYFMKHPPKTEEKEQPKKTKDEQDIEMKGKNGEDEGKEKTGSEDVDTKKPTITSPSQLEGHNHGGHGHHHSVLLLTGYKTTAAAYLLEFGVTVHSVFIGLENGIIDVEELKILLVALCFHQMFEGLALGSRIADANFPSHWHEVLLSAVFSVAAPIGISVGVGLTSTFNPSGETFLLVQGTFDGICSGILLYIGLVLLLKDFPEDMKRHCQGHKYEYCRRAVMFVALYIGAGMMAFIGKYL